MTTERATFEYDSDSGKILEVIEKINKAGYGIAAGESEYLVKGLEDDRDGRRLEAFLSEIGGLTSINVNWISGKVILKYIPTILNQTDIRNLLTENGFEAVVISGEMADVESIARQEEVRLQRFDLIIGLVFTIPLFSLSMARDFGLLGSWAHQPWVNWLMAALATPVQFYVGRKYYRD